MSVTVKVADKVNNAAVRDAIFMTLDTQTVRDKQQCKMSDRKERIIISCCLYDLFILFLFFLNKSLFRKLSWSLLFEPFESVSDMIHLQHDLKIKIHISFCTSLFQVLHHHPLPLWPCRLQRVPNVLKVQSLSPGHTGAISVTVPFIT